MFINYFHHEPQLIYVLPLSQILLDLSSAILAIITACIFFTRSGWFLRLIFLQVILYVITDLIASTSMYNNTWVYNLFMPLETAVLLGVVVVWFQSFRSVLVALAAYALFIIVYVLDCMLLNFSENFLYHASIFQGFLLSAAMGVWLFHMYTAGGNIPGKLAGLGMLVYFACTIPYLCLIYYFDKVDPFFNQALFQHIVLVLAHVRYLLIAVAFFMNGRNKLQTQ